MPPLALKTGKFMMQATLSEAERVSKTETEILVSAEQYEWLCQIMDEAPTPAPRLRAALAQKPVWDD